MKDKALDVVMETLGMRISDLQLQLDCKKIDIESRDRKIAELEKEIQKLKGENQNA